MLSNVLLDANLMLENKDHVDNFANILRKFNSMVNNVVIR